MTFIGRVIIVLCILLNLDGILGHSAGRDTAFAPLYQSDTIMVITTRESDQHLLARLISAEARSESMLGMRAVGDVVVHTARRKGWTIYEVIHYVGKFDGICDDSFVEEPSERCLRAAKYALDGDHVLPEGVTFYYNPMTATDTAWINFISKYAYGDIGDHRFCYHPDYYPG